MKKGLVLGGGGSKGAYQIGALKALKKLKYDYQIVTGTSIGAINGAFFVSKQFKECEYLWHIIDNKKIYNKKILNEQDTIKMLTSNILVKNGIETTTMENIIKKHLNIDKFFKSNIDYALTSYNKTKFKPVTKRKKELTKNNLVDYIMASATLYPAFKPKKIEEHEYIDGGFHDTLPINLAIDLGATEIVAIDLDTFGIKSNNIDKKIPITYIKPKQNLGNIAHFSSTNSKKIIKYGYNDTMKVYNLYDGNYYTFKKNHLQNLYKKYNKTYEKILNKYIKNKLSFNTTIETLAEHLNLKDEIVYSQYNYIYNIKKEIKKIKLLNETLIEEKIKVNALKEIITSKWLVFYLYKCLKTKHKSLNLYSKILRRPFINAALLYSIMEE